MASLALSRKAEKLSLQEGQRLPISEADFMTSATQKKRASPPAPAMTRMETVSAAAREISTAFGFGAFGKKRRRKKLSNLDMGMFRTKAMHREANSGPNASHRALAAAEAVSPELSRQAAISTRPALIGLFLIFFHI